MMNPFEWGPGGSRGTYAILSAVISAAEDARKKLLELAAPMLDAGSPDDLETADGVIWVKKRSEKTHCVERCAPICARSPEHGRFDADYTLTNCMMTFVEVEVDTETGKLDLLRVVNATDVGTVIDPQGLEGQMNGCLGTAGIDSAIFEETVIDPTTGHMLNCEHDRLQVADNRRAAANRERCPGNAFRYPPLPRNRRWRGGHFRRTVRRDDGRLERNRGLDRELPGDAGEGAQGPGEGAGRESEGRCKMIDFVHHDAQSVDEAIALLSEHRGAAKINAGGTDLLSVLKNEILPAYPRMIVNIKTIPDLDYIREGGTVAIGALSRLSDIVRSPLVGGKFPLLVESARAVASPQIRNVATIGGNLCQDVRCWYYRYPDSIGGRVMCARKGRGPCLAVKGDNRYHALMNGKKCFAVCPSDTATALTALDAAVLIVGPAGERSVAVDAFYNPYGQRPCPRRDGAGRRDPRPERGRPADVS